jgi:glyoxylase-like metal-dependent hydrolase (beta-lactamase superfamily II)
MTDDGTDTREVSPATLQDRIDAGEPVRVLDLRDRDEVEQWRLTGPSVTLTQKANNRFVQARVTGDVDEFVADIDGEGPITVVCARGEASDVVAEGLREAGYDAHNLAGGMEAWARLVRTATVDAGLDRGTLVQYRRPASGCLGYMLIAGEPTESGSGDRPALVVDPLAAATDCYVADAAERGATVEYVLDTHVHADHVSGLRDLAEATGATPVMSERATDRGVTFADQITTVTGGDELAVGDLSVEVVAAPGHTTGMVALAVGDALVTGDSLFVDSVARPDLERGADGAADLARDLYRTLTDRFARFPDETVVAPGHHAEGTRPAADGAVTATLGECRDLRPFAMDAAEFVAYVTGDMPPRPANFERVIQINLGRESASDDEAFELELGPNNCAATLAEP